MVVGSSGYIHVEDPGQEWEDRSSSDTGMAAEYSSGAAALHGTVTSTGSSHNSQIVGTGDPRRPEGTRGTTRSTEIN